MNVASRRPRRSDDGMGALRSIGAMALLSAFAGVLVAGLLIPVTSFIGVTSNSVADGFEKLPLALRETPTPQRTKVLTANGKLLAYFYSQNRQNTSLTRIAPIMQQALLSIEDYRFYKHGAVDVKGTARALVNNAADGTTQGGSTITQQLVKNILVQQARTPAERKAATAVSPARKIRELKYAMSYEQQHTKREILRNYFNISYFGDGAYGVSAAAKHYFSTDASRLTLTQSAALAGLVKNPVQYDPVTYPENALRRRNTVLATMERQGEITHAQADKALAMPLGLRITSFSNGCVSSKAPFFCDYVRRYLLQDRSLGATADARQHTLETGGLTIRTTIDLSMQKATDRAVRARVDPSDLAIGAQALVRPGTGKVMALSQSRPMGNLKKSGQTYINYTVPKSLGGSNGFQAGSTFKAFTAAAALSKGYPTSTFFNAPQQMTIPSGSYFTCTGDGTSAWDVKNSTGAGGFDLTKGFRQSVNTYFAQLEKLTGLCSVTKTATKMGITFRKAADHHRRNDEVPSFTLGVVDVSPLDMAAAYATFPARGYYCKPRPVTEIQRPGGRVLKKYSGECTKVLSTAVADTVNKILRGVQSPGGFGANLQLDKPSAAKTGTTTSNKAVWYMGYTPALVNATMIAGANKEGQPISLTGKKLHGQFLSFDAIGGAALAGPMWAAAMRAIQDELPDLNFESPGSLGPAPEDTPKRPEPKPGKGDGKGKGKPRGGNGGGGGGGHGKPHRGH